jgi:hypothetical protein
LGVIDEPALNMAFALIEADFSLRVEQCGGSEDELNAIVDVIITTKTVKLSVNIFLKDIFLF